MPDSERWNQIEELFDRVADLPGHERSAALEQACQGDRDLFDQVMRLLAHDQPQDGSPRVSEVISRFTAVASASAAAGAPGFAGRTIGAYRIVREVGRGGMGMVFEAVRDDGQFEKRVALKLATHAVYSPEFLTRFRHERQILAQLEHPHIARLLDGGATDEQIPYFAMEFVDGEAIDRYVETHSLPLEERVRLFLQVCEAVEYAHSRLVIHRDLKPGNILVADGFARLLDFGIAKLAAVEDGLTMTGAGPAPLTPDYCSPEQMRGQEVTARSDVYSLGLILYRLLTGEQGQKADTASVTALERSICDDVPGRPSATAAASGKTGLARQLRGDLDTIVLTAIAKEPSRRYPSVAALREDLQSFLDAKPIQARRQSAWYKASRFARRHWVGVAAAAAVVAALALGLASTIYQARRAERRFQQVRKIARALLEDVEEAIRDVPATIKAQEVVVRTAVEYLDALMAEAGGDPALQAEAAHGYLQVADVAYDRSRPSLNKPAEARRYLERAIAILDPLQRSRPNDEHVAHLTIRAHRSYALFLKSSGETFPKVLAEFDRAVALAERESLRSAIADEELMIEIFDAYKDRVRETYTSSDARPLVAPMIKLAERLVATQGETTNALGRLALAYSQAGKVMDFDGEYEQAIRYFRRQAEMQAKVTARLPDSSNARRNLSIAWANLGDALMNLAGFRFEGYGPQSPVSPKTRAEALDAYTKALDLAQWRYDADPKNDLVRLDLAIVLGRTGFSHPAGDPQGNRLLERALEISAQLPDSITRLAPGPLALQDRGKLAERHRESGNFELARQTWAESETTFGRLLPAVGNLPALQTVMVRIYMNWATELARRGDRTGTLATARKVEQLIEEMATGRAPAAPDQLVWPIRLMGWTASVRELLGDEAEARALREGSAAGWRQVLANAEVSRRVQREAREALAAKR
ncbi:MAG: serine/threonine protein kinase [Bryobacterales bacterium]|nr:serine/threonine protein kinase [Bryobacterales bacterium]